MRLISTEVLSPGMILARAIFNDNGQVLIQDGMVLTERMIARLHHFNITFVYIQDERTKDIIVRRPIPEQLRREAVKTIETTFKQIQNEQKLSASFLMEQASKKFKQLIRTILEELTSNSDLLTLLSEVYSYDNYIFTHSLNVTMYSLAIGIELRLPQKQLEQLGLGAILHDVGKMMIPLDILMKPGRLLDTEYDEMKKHADYGFQMLRETHSIPLVVAHCAYQHHERLNGSGYPRQLQDEQIHFFSKIIAIADVFDAVTSNRVYRKAMLPHEGLEILYSGVGTLFDKDCVEAFRRSVALYPNGLSVQLSDGRKGVVAEQTPGMSERPVIRIVEQDGQAVTESYNIRLSEALDVMIVGCDTTFLGELQQMIEKKDG